MNQHAAVISVIIPSLLALMSYSTGLSADSGQIVIRAPSISLGDNFKFFRNPVILNFTLPSNTLVSTEPSENAILSLEANNLNMSHDEVYINPPTTTCFVDGVDIDANDSASIGYLDTHSVKGDIRFWHTLTTTFTGSMLHPGSNTMMVCSRDDNGRFDASHDAQGSGGIDDFKIRSIVLHYKR